MQGAAAFETIRDINVASRLIGDMSGATLDDPLFDRYKKLGCSISPVGKDTDDYKMVANYLEKTYEPVKVGEIFGKAIVCSDAAAEAARYGFTAVDRPEGFLVLAVASLGEQVTELTSPPENSTSLEEKKLGVVGLGRKKTDESEHFTWKDDIKVPCGKLIPSEHEESQLEYNEYAVYDPQQVSICFLVAVKFEEKDVEYDTAE
ncbi:UNVERIFIED_CONTAM: protein ADP-ribosyltransferase PARP3 [Sesamum angustifolium]|uniref:Poly [ADP-ribose] polymerase n=1 Tax=Sesamum angustifolium TaxID=2727405 RepID=A0AAW2QPN5_9LAMI